MFGTLSPNRKRLAYAATLGVCAVAAAATIAVTLRGGLQRVVDPEYLTADAEPTADPKQSSESKQIEKDAIEPDRVMSRSPRGPATNSVASNTPKRERKLWRDVLALTRKTVPDQPSALLQDPATAATVYYASPESSAVENLTPLAGVDTWVERGPRPMTNADGGTAGIISPEGRNPAGGAIQAIAQLKQTPFYTGNPDVIYLAAVNGGVWKTTNGTAASPSWTPLTDQGQFNGGGLAVGMSLNSLEISPLDPNTIFVGAGRTSAFAEFGGELFGIARTTNGGATWTVVNIAGLSIRSIVPTMVTESGQQVVLAGAAASLSGGVGGIYRSTDGGDSYTLVTNGIPATAVTDLVATPGVPTQFYAATREGKIYISNDTGASWTLATGTGFTVIPLARVLLSVHHRVGNDVVYAGVIGTNDKLSAVYRSTNQGASWTNLGLPPTDIFPGGQGSLHGAIEAHPTDPNTVYLGGDAGPRLARNVSGAWEVLDFADTNNTMPHGDTRDLDFDLAGNVLRADDGGIYKLNDPNTPGRYWSSLCGNLGATEIHAATYDSLSDISIASFQDAAVHYQQSTGNLIWDQLSDYSAEGSIILVDADQSTHPGTSIRFFGRKLPKERWTFSAANTLVNTATIAYNITSGPGTGMDVFSFDINPNGVDGQARLNRLNPARMLFSGSYIYESMDSGDTVATLEPLPGGVASSIFANAPLTYGGLNGDGAPNPGSFYLGGSSGAIYHRANDSSPIVTLPAYPGYYIKALVSDPKNVSHVFVADEANKIWGSFDEGATWTDLTANLGSLTLIPYVKTIEIFNPPGSLDSILVVGGLGGIWQMPNPRVAGGNWAPLGTNLPQAFFFDVRYDPTDNVLITGALGRGAWTLSGCAGPTTVAAIQVARPSPSVARLTWSAIADASAYDVVRGGLTVLQSSGGNFTAATTDCAASGIVDLFHEDAETPQPGNGFWYLVRGRNCGGGGSYDSGSTSQAGSRDAEIRASSAACN